jgi:hypothetical protein
VPIASSRFFAPRDDFGGEDRVKPTRLGLQKHECAQRQPSPSGRGPGVWTLCVCIWTTRHATKRNGRGQGEGKGEGLDVDSSSAGIGLGASTPSSEISAGRGCSVAFRRVTPRAFVPPSKTPVHAQPVPDDRSAAVKGSMHEKRSGAVGRASYLRTGWISPLRSQSQLRKMLRPTPHPALYPALSRRERVLRLSLMKFQNNLRNVQFPDPLPPGALREKGSLHRVLGENCSSVMSPLISKWIPQS